MKKIKVIISDCHLSGGRYFQKHLNPHEDFFFDEDMISFFDFFSTGEYGDGCQTELIINGDYLDFLNIPFQDEFIDVITEDFALYKLDCILEGHPQVMEALRRFVSRKGKTITYNIGNHDADFFFPKVREKFIRTIDPEGKFPSEKIKFNYESPVINLEGGIQVHHGNQFEAVHFFNYQKTVLTDWVDKPILNIPWGSFYVLKIVNRFKWEREYVDKVRPVKGMLLWGLLFDTLFTLKFMIFSAFYFLKTRFIYSPKRRSRLGVTLKIFQQESTTFLQDLENDAREILEQQSDIHTVIMGHTHHPLWKVYSDGKTYINTGTWTKMINLDLRRFGTAYQLTFALIEYDEQGQATASLQEWKGEHKPFRQFSR